MRIAVITPYCREPIDKIKRCHQSVLDQTVIQNGHIVTHFLIADGYPRSEIETWSGVSHSVLVNHNDYGDTPRLVGSASAATMCYDAVAFLDADNWFDPTHLEELMKVQEETKADVVTCPRTLRRLDGSVMGDCIESDGDQFNDTNCYLIMQRAFPLFSAWGFKDPSLSIIGDRIFWDAIKKSNCKVARSNKATIQYETSFATHYRQFGETPPPGCKLILQTTDGRHVMMKWETFLDYMSKQQIKFG